MANDKFDAKKLMAEYERAEKELQHAQTLLDEAAEKRSSICEAMYKELGSAVLAPTKGLFAGQRLKLIKRENKDKESGEITSTTYFMKRESTSEVVEL